MDAYQLKWTWLHTIMSCLLTRNCWKNLTVKQWRPTKCDYSGRKCSKMALNEFEFAIFACLGVLLHLLNTQHWQNWVQVLHRLHGHWNQKSLILLNLLHLCTANFAVLLNFAKFGEFFPIKCKGNIFSW